MTADGGDDPGLTRVANPNWQLAWNNALECPSECPSGNSRRQATINAHRPGTHFLWGTHLAHPFASGMSELLD